MNNVLGQGTGSDNNFVRMDPSKGRVQHFFFVKSEENSTLFKTIPKLV